MATGLCIFLGSSVQTSFSLNAAPAADATLTPEDVNDIQEELLPAQSQSYVFGLKLGLPTDVLDFIHSKYTEPRECLLQVLLEFTKQTEPRPTWRVIVNALKSSAVGLYELADVVETAHFPDPAATRIIEPDSIGENFDCYSHLTFIILNF